MDPSLSTSDAHLLFGKLYRKSRPEELQKRIDAVVSSTSDVFVRIKKIEDLDAGFARKNKGIESKKTNTRSRATSGGGSGPKKQRKKSKAKEKISKAGFFARMFGSEISRWGTQTGTLDGGIFSRNPTLSPKILELFQSLSETQIQGTVAIFKGMMGSIWEQLEPARYNILISTYQFLIEFVKAEAILRSSDLTSDLSTVTIRLQKSYATMSNYPDYNKVILHDFIELVSQSEKFSEDISLLKETLEHLLSFEDQKPGLKDSILAMYVLARKKLVSWDDVCRELKVGAPQLQKYRAPEVVMELIHKKIRVLKEKLSQNISEIKEAEKIKKSYLEVDASGKLKVDFLNPIVEDVLRRNYNDQKLSPEFIKSYKSEPHKLLYCIMKDLELNLVFLLVSTVMTKGQGQHSEEVIIFKLGLFTKKHTLFMQEYRAIEQFMKTNKDMMYSFKDYLQDTKEEPELKERREFLKIAKGSMKVMGSIVSDLQVVLDNNEAALDLERFGKATESLILGKALTIESLDVKPRFIPFADRHIVASSRMNDANVASLLMDYVGFLFNYLYIFRDPEVGSLLSSVPTKTKENEKVKNELERLGISVASKNKRVDS